MYALSYNFLFGKLGLVFVFYADLLQGVKFLGFDSFDLASLVFKLLADLAALFKVIKSLMFDLVSVSRDLSADGSSVVAEMMFLLIFEDLLLILRALLLINDAEERVTLQLGLLGEHFFALHELNLASNVQITSLTGTLFSFV